ncbi:unnamed protein product [Timema podura]|uniref:RING-type E3 ubiquitin transferase n=1 Tax=Timema podura TaxID=61482 RepID=A0ABN7NUK8_TIMPD|nr:unnamed protein product [Timema podura]
MVPYRRANTPGVSPVSKEEELSLAITKLCANSVALNNFRTFRMWESARGLNELNDSIVELLACPICYESMAPPIFMCMNGHHTCQNCRLKVSACPTCKCLLGDIRNRFAETIAEKLTYLCRYVKRGCRERLSIADKFTHEEECASRPCICRICASWCGEFSELLEHVRTAHLHRLRNEDINTVHSKYFDENTSNEIIVLLTFQGRNGRNRSLSGKRQSSSWLFSRS